jgi:hypothetical protein
MTNKDKKMTPAELFPMGNGVLGKIVSRLINFLAKKR